MPFLPELVGFSKFKHSPSLFFEERQLCIPLFVFSPAQQSRLDDEEFVPWPDYQYDDELSKTLLLFKVVSGSTSNPRYLHR